MISFLDWFCQWLPRFVIRRDGAPYMTRYYLLGRDGSQKAWGFLAWSPIKVFLHNLHASDGPERHNHPYGLSVSLILAGGYVEERGALVTSRRTFRPGQVNVIHANTYHRLELPQWGSSWSLFVAGPKRQAWGFIGKDGYRNATGVKPS